MFAIRSRKKVCLRALRELAFTMVGSPECVGKELFGRRQQGHQGLRQVLCNTEIHGLYEILCSNLGLFDTRCIIECFDARGTQV